MNNDLYKIFENSYFNQKYYLKEFKGSGAFGAVFLADEVVGGTKIQEVAIKAIRKDKMPSDIIAKELVTAIRLKHPNLINCITSEEGRLKHSVFDYDCFGLVMEIASGTLEDYLQASRVLPVSEVREIVEAIASGLVYLHGQSVTHRDLKPANVLRVGNVWKISDFGIARQMSRESGTMTTSLTGTPIYMPPEVYAAYSEDAPMKVSPAWDIWSLGVMIVEMLTGALPFDGVTDIWKMNIKIKENLPAPFDSIIQNCLREDPKLRLNAKQLLEKNIQIDIEEANKYYNRAFEKHNIGDYQGALRDYNEAIRCNPDDADAYINRGIVKRALGDNQGALIDYTEAIRINPDHANAYYYRGYIKDNLGDKQGAIGDYTEAIRINPDFVQAYIGRGIVEVALGYTRRPIADYTRVIRINPDHADAYYLRGLAKDGLKAIADYTEAIRINPDHADAYHSRGLAKNGLKDKEGAIADYTEAIRINPNHADAYRSRGLVKEYLGDKQGAIADLSEIIRINPSDAYTYYSRGLLKEQIDDKKGALEDLRKSSSLYKQQGDVENYYYKYAIAHEIQKLK
jgi:serine/threonine protein kinase